MLAVQSITAQQADFTLQIGGPTDVDLKVTAFEGTEGISELYEFQIELCSEDADIDLDAPMGEPCTLEIVGDSGPRYVNGIVRRFERTGGGSQLTYYAADVVPVHWLLTKHHQSRVFEPSRCPDMSVPGIIRKVFADTGLDEQTYRFALEQDYEQREFVVQCVTRNSRLSTSVGCSTRANL